MSLNTVVLTDTLDQWRQKTNLAIALLNTLAGVGTVLSVVSPSTGQTLIYDGTSFNNVSISGDITIDGSGVATVVGGVDAITKGRLAFAGSIRTLY